MHRIQEEKKRECVSFFFFISINKRKYTDQALGGYICTNGRHIACKCMSNDQ